MVDCAVDWVWSDRMTMRCVSSACRRCRRLEWTCWGFDEERGEVRVGGGLEVGGGSGGGGGGEGAEEGGRGSSGCQNCILWGRWEGGGGDGYLEVAAYGAFRKSAVNVGQDSMRENIFRRGCFGVCLLGQICSKWFVDEQKIGDCLDNATCM